MTLTVLNTFAPTYVSTAGGTNMVNVGSGTVQGITNPLYIESATPATTIDVNDGTDATARVATLGDSTLGNQGIWGTIGGLAPATIFYPSSDLSAFNVTTGSAGGTVDVLNTFASTDLNRAGGSDTVNVGLGKVGQVGSPLYITGATSQTTLNINDGSDTATHTVVLSAYTPANDTSAWGLVSGLAAGTINYRYAAVHSVTVTAGTGADIVNILATGGPATYVTSESVDWVNVELGNVLGIAGPLYIENAQSLTSLAILDGSDTLARTVTLNSFTYTDGTAFGSITGLTQAPINYRYANVGNVSLTLGTGNDVEDVEATGVPVWLESVGGADVVNVGSNGSVGAIAAALDVINDTSSTGLNVNDESDQNSRTATLSTDKDIIDGLNWGLLSGLAPAPINFQYDGSSALYLNLGQGANTINVEGTGVPTYLTTISGAGSKITVASSPYLAGIEGNLYVESGTPELTALNIGDAGDPAVRNAELETFTPRFDPVPWGSIVGLAPASINFNWSGINGSVNIQSGPGTKWNVVINAIESQVGFVPVVSDGYVINASYSPNWSGYAAEANFSNQQSNSVSAVSGSWIVPSVTGNPGSSTNSAVWVGIDGFNGQTVEQVGTEEDYSNGSPTYYAWWGMASTKGSITTLGDGVEYPIPSYFVPIHAGDSVTASVQYLSSGAHAGQFLLSINNNTEHMAYETYETSSQTQNPQAVRNSAEWIVEAPTNSQTFKQDPLADFGMVRFTNCTATINGYSGVINSQEWQSQAVNMTPNNFTDQALTSSLSQSGQSFTVSYDPLGLITYTAPVVTNITRAVPATVGGSLGFESMTLGSNEPREVSEAMMAGTESATAPVFDQALDELGTASAAAPRMSLSRKARRS